MGYCNTALDDTIAKAQAELDLDKQAALWGEAIKTIWSDAVGISLLDTQSNYENSSRIQGFQPPEYSFPFYYPVSVNP